jgi:hypothetical protein
MGKTTPEVRHRVRALGIRIAELQAAGATHHPVLAATLTDLQAEQAVWKLLLVTRRLQLEERVISLARWRDGYASVGPAGAATTRLPALPRLPVQGRAE